MAINKIGFPLVTLSEAKGLDTARFFAEFIPSLCSGQALSDGRFFAEFILSEAKGSE